MAVGTTRAKRRLGRHIRPYVERAGYLDDVAALAAETRVSRQSIYRLLNGDNLISYHRFVAVLTALGMTKAERDDAVAVYHLAEAPTAEISDAADLPKAYARLRADESEASLARTADTILIPGLLQTAGYAAALAERSRILSRGEWAAERAAAERRERQAVLTREPRPLELHALIDEAAIRRRLGGTVVWREQLDHLLAMSETSNVTVQILPFTAGAYETMAGPLLVLSYPEADEPESVHMDLHTGSITVEAEDDVRRFTAAWLEVRQLCLPADESRRFIREVRDSEH
jgi:transcriptional regulator with XRE-family HTH domain